MNVDGQRTDIIIDENERIITAMEGGNNFFVFLTERRLYFKGKSYSIDANRWMSSRVEGVVALENISFTKFVHMQNIGYLIAAIVMTVLAVLAAPGAGFLHVGQLIFVLFAVAAVIAFVRYFRSKKSLFWVNFPGGGFAFEALGYQIGEIRHFQRMLHLLKDKRRRLPTNKV